MDVKTNALSTQKYLSSANRIYACQSLNIINNTLDT
ncbi:unnamed protein product [Nezara viridula]|uniref:Uncharacterized protein n=1 Tax=Nezara viridula TaxID=85310 RepID=A0A9P0E8V6_NEZVI|nr:unnamed protein product [Nezara viridula]CAH1390624.1 unnamed protein product [Nezara viridula]CAH1390627.1 unnamed protein product [Nezara viridula]